MQQKDIQKLQRCSHVEANTASGDQQVALLVFAESR